MTRFFRLPALVKWVLWIGWVLLLFMTIMRLGFYLFFNKQGNSFSAMIPSFWLGFRFDLRTVSIILLPILLLGSIRPLNPFYSAIARRLWLLLFGILCFLIIVFYLVDFAHYAYLIQRLNASVLNFLQDAGISMDMVWTSYPVVKFTIAILLCSFALYWLIRKGFRVIKLKNSPVSKKQSILSFVLVFLLFAFFVFGRFNQFPLRWSDAFVLGNDYKAGIALNPFETFFNTLKFRTSTFDEKKVNQSFGVLAPYFGWSPNDKLNYTRLSKIKDTTQGQPLNVVLVICESFSAFKSSMWNNPLNTTPFFDSLSKNGLFFENCFTPTFGTARGVWATITGLPDVEMPTTASRNPLIVDQHTILNDFKQYEKYYFIGGSPSWANIRGVLMNNIKGLRLYDQESFNVPRLDVWGISDKNLFLESAKVLSKETKPFFAIIQTADNHRPYSIPEEDKDFLVKQTTVDSLNQFGFKDQVSYELKLKEYNAFRYTDYTFAKFFEAVSKLPSFENTMFVFVGDHGIAGDAGKMFPSAWTEQRLTAMHVPLLFYCPSRLKPQRVDRICSQIDIMATIGSICGVNYRNTTLGRDLTDSTQKPFAFIFDPDILQAGVVMGDFFYRKQLRTAKEEIVSIKRNGAPQIDDSTKIELRKLTEGLYETSRYLLLNNKKESNQ